MLLAVVNVVCTDITLILFGHILNLSFASKQSWKREEKEVCVFIP